MYRVSVITETPKELKKEKRTSLWFTVVKSFLNILPPYKTSFLPPCRNQKQKNTGGLVNLVDGIGIAHREDSSQTSAISSQLVKTEGNTQSDQKVQSAYSKSISVLN